VITRSNERANVAETVWSDGWTDAGPIVIDYSRRPSGRPNDPQSGTWPSDDEVTTVSLLAKTGGLGSAVMGWARRQWCGRSGMHRRQAARLKLSIRRRQWREIARHRTRSALCCAVVTSCWMLLLLLLPINQPTSSVTTNTSTCRQHGATALLWKTSPCCSYARKTHVYRLQTKCIHRSARSVSPDCINPF